MFYDASLCNWLLLLVDTAGVIELVELALGLRACAWTGTVGCTDA